MSVLSEECEFLGDVTGRRLAYQYYLGAEPSIVFLPGFNSHMFGLKARYLGHCALDRGLGYIRFDYRGHGASSGRLQDGSIDQWLADALAVIKACTRGPVLAVGASLGLWIALLLARGDDVRVAGILGVGGAPDAGQRMFDTLNDEAQRALARDGIAFRPSRYGDGPYPVTARMLAAGRSHQVLDGGWTLSCPLRLLHGLDDPDVPWSYAVRALECLNGADVELRLIKGGDHRLSRDTDLAAIGRAVDELLSIGSPRQGGDA